MHIWPTNSSTKLLASALLALGLFLTANQFRLPPKARVNVSPVIQVVIPAPIQTFMYAGDRHLAANLETMRVAAVGASEEQVLAGYRIRAYDLISELNPCHEDNYYLANAMLSWGGGVDKANSILERATECRVWDDLPPFFLSFNRYFFYRDLDGAIQAMETAAARSKDNSSTYKRAAIVMAAEKFNDEKIAVDYLRNERDNAKDPQLAKGLDRRLKRLEGLVSLREAQSRFEKEKGRPLKNQEELLSSGILKSFPEDPTHIGYEFIDGQFRLRAVNVGGLIEVR